MDNAEVRQWARETGRPVSDRGAISSELKEAYRAAHNGDAEPAPDYPPGMSDADFDLAEAELPQALIDDLVMPAEERPQRPKATSRSTGSRLAARLKPGTRKGTRKGRGRTGTARPRISTSELIGSAWRIGAKLAQPIPPMYRTLRLQSVIAGPLLDEQVKGTFIDPLLQPLARLAAAGETVSALLAPNLGIGAAAYHQAQCARSGTEPNPVVMQVCGEMVRHGLICMMRVGGDAFAAQLAREREDEERFGGSVDMIMAWIFSPPADPAQEEADIAAMAARFAGEDVPEPAEAETMPV